jgi:hypothetical protein
MIMNKDYFVSDAKYVELDFDLNYRSMLEEARALKQHYITHRQGSYDHQGWRSLVLHGWDESQSGHWRDYGYENIEQVVKNLHWTGYADRCPITTDFIKNHFPSKLLGRVRFMLLEAGGHIGLHTDSSVPLLENTNISLSNPRECDWQWGDGETLFMQPGKTYVMNIHYPHSVFNRSNEDRYHLIVHRLDCTEAWKEKLNSACALKNITGSYINHEVLI